MKKDLTKILIITSILSPVVASAQYFQTIIFMLTDLRYIITTLEGIMFVLAFVYFFWGMAQFILNAGDAKVRAEGRQKMIWGVIAITVMFSVFGLVRWLQSTFGIVNNQPIEIPII